ncbi:MAG: sporulation protein YjcZ [Candidatus Cloacimonetes bacterium]|nr:sporulation protein YjcZ [Candidatus Cloacimonadota bacterium]
MTKNFVVLFVLLIIFGCSYNRPPSRRYIEKHALHEELLFKSFGTYINPSAEYSNEPVEGTLKITKTNFRFDDDNLVTVDGRYIKQGVNLKLSYIKNIRVLDEKINDQVAFQFELGDTETSIFTSEKAEELVNLIKFLKDDSEMKE